MDHDGLKSVYCPFCGGSLGKGDLVSRADSEGTLIDCVILVKCGICDGGALNLEGTETTLCRECHIRRSLKASSTSR